VSKSTNLPARIQSIEARERPTSESHEDCVVDFFACGAPPGVWRGSRGERMSMGARIRGFPNRNTLRDMDMREHIAGHAAGFNARAASLGPLSRVLLILIAIFALLAVLVLAIPLVLLSAIVFLGLRLWWRLKLWWAGDSARFRPGQIDNEGRQNVRVRVPEEG
jgi:hypothetical protein